MAQHDLYRVERHVALGDARIAKQLALIEQLGRDGHDTRAAQAFLATIEETQRLHIQHRDRLAREYRTPTAPPATSGESGRATPGLDPGLDPGAAG